MKHLAAYLLLKIGGNDAPSADDVTALLEKAGIDVDQTRLTQLLSDLEGKDLAEIIKDGSEKLAAATAAVSAGAAPAAAASAAAPADAPAAKEKPKVEEVDALDGGMDMFGGGGGGGGDY